MNWLDKRKRLERRAHKAFERVGTVTPTSGDPFEVRGVLHEDRQAESLAEEIGINATDIVFELRKETETAIYRVEMFPRRNNLFGQLALETTTYEIIYVHQNDTLLFLGLAGPRP